jgi:hypothetical protein
MWKGVLVGINTPREVHQRRGGRVWGTHMLNTCHKLLHISHDARVTQFKNVHPHCDRAEAQDSRPFARSPLAWALMSHPSRKTAKLPIRFTFNPKNYQFHISVLNSVWWWSRPEILTVKAEPPRRPKPSPFKFYHQINWSHAGRHSAVPLGEFGRR